MTEHLTLHEAFGMNAEEFASKFRSVHLDEQVSALRALARGYGADAQTEQQLRKSERAVRLWSSQRRVRQAADDLEELWRLHAMHMEEY